MKCYNTNCEHRQEAGICGFRPTFTLDCDKFMKADEVSVSSNSLLCAIREAYLAGEKQGQANAKSIYWSSYPETEPDEAADKYVEQFKAHNSSNSGITST